MLFGHQNDDASQPAPAVETPVLDTNTNPLAVDPTTGASLPTVQQADEPAQPSVLNQPAVSAPIVPASEESVEPTTPFTAPPVEEASPIAATSFTASPSTDSTTPDSTPVPDIASDTLLALKQQALTELSPLVDKLDQSPEERFRTTMMMIQSTDNQALIQTAYDAAQAITDEKVRAQALLDVINEINYFTQQSQPANH